MKKILIIIILFPLFESLYSQNQVIPLVYDISVSSYDRGYRSGEYYKDTFNHLDNFEGTWVYTSGSTSFTLVLEKKEQYHMSISDGTDYYQDFLIGEYQYLENGVEQVNSLSNLQINFNHPYSYNLVGDILHTYDASEAGSCSGCYPSVLAIKCTFSEPGVSDSYRTMMLWYINDNGIEKLWGVVHGNESTNNNSNFKVPYGRYKYFIKQP